MDKTTLGDFNPLIPSNLSIIDSGALLVNFPIKVNHTGYALEPADGFWDGLKFRGDFDGNFRGDFDGNFRGNFNGVLYDADISIPFREEMNSDPFVEALRKEYFYNHFVEWVELDK